MFGFSGHEELSDIGELVCMAARAAAAATSTRPCSPAGLLHANARTYNPVIGLMHQADPLLHNYGDSQVCGGGKV